MDYDALGIRSVCGYKKKHPPGIGRAGNLEEEEEEEEEEELEIIKRMLGNSLYAKR
jgi:hypothetical protein